MEKGQQMYHYSIVRFVPDALRQEAINLGVVLVSAEGKYASCRF